MSNGRDNSRKQKWFNPTGGDVFSTKDADIEYGITWLIHWEEKRDEDNYTDPLTVLYNEDLDNKLTAADRVRERLTEVVEQTLIENATDVQMNAYQGVFVEGKPMEQVAYEANRRYFAINAALMGQRCNAEGNTNGRWYGGLFNKMKKILLKDNEFKALTEQLQLIYSDDEATIKKWSQA